MALFNGLTENRAELKADARDPDLRPLSISLAPVHAVTWAHRIIAGLPRWKVEHSYEDRGMIHATHSTRLWKFVDDVHIAFEPGPNGSLISARSQSRIGRGDLGQNARNLRDLIRALRRADQQRLAQLANGAEVKR